MSYRANGTRENGHRANVVAPKKRTLIDDQKYEYNFEKIKNGTEFWRYQKFKKGCKGRVISRPSTNLLQNDPKHDHANNLVCKMARDTERSTYCLFYLMIVLPFVILPFVILPFVILPFVLEPSLHQGTLPNKLLFSHIFATGCN